MVEKKLFVGLSDFVDFIKKEDNEIEKIEEVKKNIQENKTEQLKQTV